jgi:hypothetical protein
MKNYLIHPTPLGLVLFLLTLLAICLIVAPSRGDTGGATAHLEAAMVELCKVNAKHPVMTRPAWRRELAQAILDAADETGEDHILLLVLFFCESSLRPAAIGSARGEVGLGQVHGLAAKGCDLSTASGQALCSAKWLKLSRSVCDGSDRQALIAYAKGAACKVVENGRLDRKIRYRLGLVRRLRTFFAR